MVNNTRFLILPWVSVKYLASKVLALSAKRISNDWITVYHHPLYLLETFVEQNRFKGLPCEILRSRSPNGAISQGRLARGPLIGLVSAKPKVPLKTDMITCSTEILRTFTSWLPLSSCLNVPCLLSPACASHADRSEPLIR